VPAASVAGNSQIVVFVDRIDEAGVGGWAADLAAPEPGMRVRVLIDDLIVDVLTCDLQREDAKLLPLRVSRIGFYYNIPGRYRDGLRHRLRFDTIDGRRLTILGRSGAAMAEYSFCLLAPNRIEGMVDGMVDGVLQGWALNVNDVAKTKLGGVRILVSTGGEPIEEFTADIYRADVAQALACDAACGFVFSPPPTLRMRTRTEFRFFAMPERLELRGSPIEVAFPADNERERINLLLERTAELFTMAYHLSRELKAALPAERYLLSDYERWAKISLPLAAGRAARRYGALPENRPLVSVICPVFRPEIGAFLAAIDSIRSQSYENWQLILVDAASRNAQLDAVLAALTAADPRIRLVRRARNGGISRATNAGLQDAAGDLVAFFDHDDLLESCALEVMVRAWACTGARLLYSDEDKVDRSGRLSEPHFKPAFNYRLLLELNYICHFVVMERSLLRQLGDLDAKLDGAQDHDLLLRAAEILEPERICHVPEVLYHWRKSEGSTALAGGRAKPEAAGAGARAVAAHLRRRGIGGKVQPRGTLTAYQISWAPAADDAAVSIIIPFRDHVKMTADCVAAIRAHTQGVTYEIILVDNWSTTAEAEMFCTAQALMPDTRIIRVTEPFNYSRLNNIGAGAARHAFLLFLNNDVFVSDPLWLHRMVAEARVAQNIGAVGAKLTYPDGNIQHAGVVLGVGGVAEHAFRGVSARAPGYVMRAMLTQEVSAVTGACMLVRKSCFAAVGGFDEADLPVAFNDIDLCVKFLLAGWKVIYCADAVAEHRESVSRGDDFDKAKVARFMRENEVMKARYRQILPVDPLYNPHFSREGGVYRELRIIGVEDVTPSCGPGALL